MSRADDDDEVPSVWISSEGVSKFISDCTTCQTTGFDSDEIVYLELSTKMRPGKCEARSEKKTESKRSEDVTDSRHFSVVVG